MFMPNAISNQAKIDLLTKTGQFKKLVWDYAISPQEYLSMLDDNSENLTYNKRWAMVRTLERADYYTAMKLIGKDRLKKYWPKLRPKLRFDFLKESYDFVLSR